LACSSYDGSALDDKVGTKGALKIEAEKSARDHSHAKVRELCGVRNKILLFVFSGRSSRPKGVSCHAEGLASYFASLFSM
jgi:hypothetical protein